MRDIDLCWTVSPAAKPESRLRRLTYKLNELLRWTGRDFLSLRSKALLAEWPVTVEATKSIRRSLFQHEIRQVRNYRLFKFVENLQECA